MEGKRFAPSKATRKHSEIRKNFVEGYQHELDHCRNVAFHINCFDQIGWKDPYPKETRYRPAFSIEDVSQLKGNSNWKEWCSP